MIVQCPAKREQFDADAVKRRCAGGGAAERGTMVGKTSVVTVIFDPFTAGYRRPNGRRDVCLNKSPQVRIALACKGGKDVLNAGCGITSPATR